MGRQNRPKMAAQQRISILFSPRVAAKTFFVLIFVVVVAPVFANDDFDYTCFPGMPSSGVIIPRGDSNIEVSSKPFPVYCRLNPEHEYYTTGLNSSRLRIYKSLTDGRRPLDSTVLNSTTIMATINPDTKREDFVECLIDVSQTRFASSQKQPEMKGICSQHFLIGLKPLGPVNFNCISDNWMDLNCTWEEPQNPIQTKYELTYVLPGKYGALCINDIGCHSKLREHFFCEEEMNLPEISHSQPFNAYTVSVPLELAFADTTIIHVEICWREPPTFVPLNYTYHLDRIGAPMPRRSCYMNLRTTPAFRQALDVYQFLMNTSNPLLPGGSIHKLPTNIFAVVRPAPPSNLTLRPGRRSLNIDFKISVELTHFPPGLNVSIRYRSEFDDGDWTDMDTSYFDPHQEWYSVTLADLFSYTEYDVEVRLLSTTANASDTSLWSKPAKGSARTLPMVPEGPPATAQGSFELVGTLQQRTIYVYWQQIPAYMTNGPDFGYTVSEVLEDGRARFITPTIVTSAYAVFPHLSMHDYSFYVTSVNAMGNAPESSHVYVPNSDKIRGLQPRSFMKVVYTEKLVEVSWLPPENEDEVTNYTVFWCKSENSRDRPYQCDGFLDWRELPKETRMVNISLPTEGLYQFAIAANTPTKSSGMIWATCTILQNRVTGKLKTVSIDVASKDALKVRWRQECSDRIGIVTGYKVSYCVVASKDDTADCVGGKEAHIFTKPEREQVWIQGLQPWTYYKVGVTVQTRAGESEMSDYLVNRTDLDRPGSPPTKLEVLLLGKNSAQVFWQPPLVPNSPIHSYQVRLRFTDFRGMEEVREFSVESPPADVHELRFYGKYTVGVRACTRMEGIAEPLCGVDWAEDKILTGIGKSGQMRAPLVTFKNSTVVEVQWGLDFHRGGPLRQYDVAVARQGLSETHQVFSTPGDVRRIVLALDEIGSEWTPNCYNESITNMYNFSVRAVTVDEANRTYEGDWSPVEVTPAYCQSPVPWIIILFVVTFISVVAVVVTCYFCRCCRWCQKQTQVWKRVTEKVFLPSPSELAPDGIMETGPHKEDRRTIDEDALGVAKKKFPRVNSKESSETLLPEPMRTASGSSDITSGSSEVGDDHSFDEDKTHEPQQLEYIASSSQPHENGGEIGHYISVKQQQSEQPDVDYTPSCGGDVIDVFSQQQDDNHEIRRRRLPPGYSQVAQLPMPGESPTRVPPPGYSVPAVIMREEEPQQGQPAEKGYVPFKAIRNLPINKQPQLQHQQQQPASGGYISLAQAKKVGALSPSRDEATMPPQPTNLGAYSKVGLSPVQSFGPGYGQQQRFSFVTPPGQKQSQTDAQTSDRFRQHNDPPSGGSISNKISPELSDSIGPALLMSPKTLQVETKSPYSTAVTSILNSKSSMV